MDERHDLLRAMPFDRLSPSQGVARIERAVPDERPVAIEYNGVGYAVLMATPTDLEDLVNGFALTERLAEPGDAPLSVDLHHGADGVIARATLPPERTERLLDRVRHRTTDSSCGLCGVESLAQAMRPLPVVTSRTQTTKNAIFAALAALREHQPLAVATGATHAAALVGADGAIGIVREDVGRHNAMDKLIGAMRRAGTDWAGGFALLTSRCSYELVEKAALANCPLLVTISAPTGLALTRAQEAGLPLIVLARPDAALAWGADSLPFDDALA